MGSVAGVIAVALGALFVAGGAFSHATYLEPWGRGYASEFEDPRMQIVARALLAPSSHNMQPWKIQLDPSDDEVLYLYADPTRMTPAVDPLARQAVVSQGTFLAYLDVASQERGYASSIELFPQGPLDESSLAPSMAEIPIARVTLEKDSTADPVDLESLFLSDTNRDPYSTTEVTREQVVELEALAAGSGAALRILDDPRDISALGEIGSEGTRIEARYGEATREGAKLFYGTEAAKNDARSGFSVEGQGTTGAKMHLLQGAIRVYPRLNDDEAGAKRSIALTDAAVAETPAYGLITTTTNSRIAQVRACVLYARFSLRARSLGLVMQPLSQTLQEYPSMASIYADVHRRYAPDGATLQMIVRLGTATRDYPVTMRRDATSLLRDDSERPGSPG